MSLRFPLNFGVLVVVEAHLSTCSSFSFPCDKTPLADFYSLYATTVCCPCNWEPNAFESTDSNALSTMLIRCKLVSKVHRSPRHASIVPNILFSTGNDCEPKNLEPGTITCAHLCHQKATTGENRTKKNNHKDTMGWDGWKNDVAVEIVVEIGKRAKKISAANDLCAIEINPKFIYFCHKTRMQSRQKGLLAKTIVIVCVWQAFVVPVCICVWAFDGNNKSDDDGN